MTEPATGIYWRRDFSNSEVNALHADAFGTRTYSDDERDWRTLVERHSLGWATARRGDSLIGFSNVLWDGFVHAWLQDVMVATKARGEGIGTRLVSIATENARAAGCEWLHVDFEPELERFYIDSCGFRPTNAGLMQL
jgi:GNAT superfamily N-acetyltransferase